MGIKGKIKALIGPKNQYRIKAVKAQIKYRKTRRNGGVTMDSQEWAEPVEYALPGKHVFFGYYDLQQLSPGKDKALLTVVPVGADARKDPAQLQWVDTATGEYHQIGSTRAWCWQQGCRLRWHPVRPDMVMYNDVEGERYVCRVVELGSGTVETIGQAFYDITPDGRYGLSLDYSRLQRLRPGYGYGTLPDETRGEMLPDKAAIWRVDILSGETVPLVTYAQLAELCPEAAGYENYVNHISVSPDGERFSFFHLWTVGQRWDGRLYVARMDGTVLQCVEDRFIPSHYCWLGSEGLLITSVGFGGSPSYYYRYDLNTMGRTRLHNDQLERDGHPSPLPDGRWFVTDTYPQADSRQRLFLARLDGAGFQPICRVYSDPRMFEEKRCDLHPRLTPDGRTITIDCTCRDGKRSVLMLRKIGKEKS